MEIVLKFSKYGETFISLPMEVGGMIIYPINRSEFR
jgi:hypothetical protein